MRFCSNCGKENTENDDFCSACGNQLNSPSQNGSRVNGEKANVQHSKNDSSKEDTNEEIIFTALANLFRGVEGVGGRINVTNQEVILKHIN